MRGRLRDLRKAAAWTQATLANLINDARPEWYWHHTTVAKIECGERPVKFDDLFAYAEVFELLGGSRDADAWQRLAEIQTELERLDRDRSRP